MPEHFPFYGTARKMASEEWGRKNPSEQEALQDMAVPDAGAACLLEIVRRLNQAINAWAADEKKARQEKDAERPKNAVRDPSAKVGDVYYGCGDLEDGVYSQIVAAVQDGYPRMVGHWVSGSMAALSWLYDREFKTAAEALVAEAERDVAYYKPRLAAARRVLEAARSGADLTEFMGGVKIDEEDAR